GGFSAGGWRAAAGVIGSASYLYSSGAGRLGRSRRCRPGRRLEQRPVEGSEQGGEEVVQDRVLAGGGVRLAPADHVQLIQERPAGAGIRVLPGQVGQLLVVDVRVVVGADPFADRVRDGRDHQGDVAAAGPAGGDHAVGDGRRDRERQDCKNRGTHKPNPYLA